MASHDLPEWHGLILQLHRLNFAAKREKLVARPAALVPAQLCPHIAQGPSGLCPCVCARVPQPISPLFQPPNHNLIIVRSWL